MCSLTFPCLDLTKRSFDAAGLLRSYRRPEISFSGTYRRAENVRLAVGISAPVEGLVATGDRKSTISVSDLLSVIADDLQNLNKNLKSVSPRFNLSY
ncbi:uncharacterized protein LOC110030659 isoform X2 [Phalaenopsis equestris]|uniref:uncharacterized protein LOC110030659 isoform X2 n=1 Tax=Phalaenopsis equestris TaxID=78828 RepID=UPI0009E4ACD6|nr:uncharacterized protein LOC110030659 isoform X2 [Phalaenopsis equestris]